MSLTPDNLSDLHHIRQILGGRVSTPDSSEPSFYSSVKIATIKRPFHPEDSWRNLQLDHKTLSKITVSKLVELLLDLSPDISAAVWNHTRFVTKGLNLIATVPGSYVRANPANQIKETFEVHPQGKIELDRFIKRMEGYNTSGTSSLQEIFTRLFMNVFTRGATFTELVFDEDCRTPVDLAINDPWSANFKTVFDPIRGPVYGLHQWQSGQLVRLDRETIKYIPLDPAPNSPFGRPMITAGVFICTFLISLLHDLEAVIKNQGLPKIDVSVVRKEVEDSMPDDVREDETKYNEWMREIYAVIQSTIDKLKPESWYVHDDSIKVNRPIGAMAQGAMGSIHQILTQLETMATRGLKMLPLFMGSNQSRSETQVGYEFLAYRETVSSLRQILAQTGKTFSLALQAQGINAEVIVRFDEILTPDEAVLMRQAAQETPNPSAESGASRRLSQSHARSRDVSGIVGLENPIPSIFTHLNSEDVDAAESLVGTVTANTVDFEIAELWGAIVIESGLEIEDVTDDRWYFDLSEKRYLQAGGVILDGGALIQIREYLSYHFDDELFYLTEDMISGKISFQEWYTEFVHILEALHTAQYTTGRGGRNMMDDIDQEFTEHLKPLLETQLRYLFRFATDIAQNAIHFSPAQVRARASLYAHAATRAYEYGRQKAYGIPRLALPELPADGSQDCLGRCKCHWEISEFDDRWEARWTLNPSAHHCVACSENAERFNPLIINR